AFFDFKFLNPSIILTSPSSSPFSFLFSLIPSLCITSIHLFFLSLSNSSFSHSISLLHSMFSPSFSIFPLHSLCTVFIHNHSCSLFFPFFFHSCSIFFPFFFLS